MTHVLTVLATSAGAITGYELTRCWFGKRIAKSVQAGTRGGRRASDQRWPYGAEIPE